MAKFVREIINAELLSVREDTALDDALQMLLGFGITAAPVLDADGRPVGVTSLRDLVAKTQPAVKRPAVSIAASMTVTEAARVMAESRLHHLVVVGSDGRAVGMLSSIDLLRAVVGLPPAAPESFPHHDSEPGVHWTNASPFDDDHLENVPAGPGVLVLTIGGAERADLDMWAEASAALRARVRELLHLADAKTPSDPLTPEALGRLLRRRDVRFRCAAIADEATRRRVERRLQARIQGTPPPHDHVEEARSHR